MTVYTKILTPSDSNGLDLQLTGTVLDMSLQAIVSHVPNYKFSLRDTVTNLTRIVKNQDATSFEFQIMPWSDIGLRTAWLDVRDKIASANDYSVLSFGLNYNYSDNVRFSAEHSSINNATAADVSEILLTTFIAF